jgi:FkbM family methyltransferase
MRLEKNGVFYEVADGYEWFWPGFAFKAFDAFLTPDSVYVDIGAWIGPTVLYASKIAKKVIAFEPDPIAYHHLVKNIGLNEADKNVVPYPIAVSSDWKGIPFGSLATKKFGSSMSSELWGTTTGMQVPAISLESVVTMSPDFIKIDIEGGERYIFESYVNNMVLGSYMPTIHLSLHTPWFKDSIDEYAGALKKGLEVFPYFYNEALEPTTLEAAIGENTFNTIVASFKKI